MGPQTDKINFGPLFVSSISQACQIGQKKLYPGSKPLI